MAGELEPHESIWVRLGGKLAQLRDDLLDTGEPEVDDGD